MKHRCYIIISDVHSMIICTRLIACRVHVMLKAFTKACELTLIYDELNVVMVINQTYFIASLTIYHSKNSKIKKKVKKTLYYAHQGTIFLKKIVMAKNSSGCPQFDQILVRVGASYQRSLHQHRVVVDHRENLR